MEEDRITHLPRSVITEIFSYLPIEDVIATGELAPHWEDRWLATHTLNFSDRGYSIDEDTYKLFCTFVKRTLRDRIRRNREALKLVKVECFSDFWDSEAVTGFVFLAHQGRAKEIDLLLPRIASLQMDFFTTATLTSLKLVGFHLNGTYPVKFISLKTLVLVDLEFEDEYYITEILSDCPVLEYLTIDSLVFVEPHPVATKVIPFVLSRLEEAHVLSASCPLEIYSNASCLRTELKYTAQIETHNFPNLTYLELHLYSGILWDSLIEVLCSCPQLESLIVEKCEPHVDGDWTPPESTPNCLVYKLQKFCLTNYTGEVFEFEFAKYIMSHSSILTVCKVFSEGTLEEKLAMLTKLAFFPRQCELDFD